LKAKKSYGQHFLNKPDIASRIADSLSPDGEYNNVLEVGPGTGILTQFLLGKDFNLSVVEADRDMVTILEKKYPNLSANIISADFLKLELKEVFAEQAFALIGNFPYNISSQILFKMLEYRDQIPEMVGMFQKEVAERIVAGPGSKTYGVISILVQAWYKGEYLFSVDKSCFNPPPKVQSGVIRLMRKEQEVLGCDVHLFRKIVKQTFGQRRKMLRNTLKAFVSNSEVLKDDFFNKRPERLSVEDFIELTNFIKKELGG